MHRPRQLRDWQGQRRVVEPLELHANSAVLPDVAGIVLVLVGRIGELDEEQRAHAEPRRAAPWLVVLSSCSCVLRHLLLPGT